MSEGAGWAGKRICRACGERLASRVRPDAVFCSAACRSRQWRADRRLRKRLAAVQGGAGEVECPECGHRWVAGVDRRSDALFCSARCKVRAWRRRKETFGERSQ
ncbi:hypothetical protein EW053_37255 [Streptomyces sp. IB2014 016-6]|nr:hypothetical protein EW053_37255 [Streptomyces sp. IB2014 016-6]